VTPDDGMPYTVETVGRPHALRLVRATYPIVESTTARYADMDQYSHLNNLALESMHENARAVLNERVFPGTHTHTGPRTQVVNSQTIVHFLAQARWPCDVDTAIGVSRIGRTSFVESSALFVGDTCISVCDAVMVAFDERPVTIGDDHRERLEALSLRTGPNKPNGDPA
jgi:acyl-CoA thioester hydrolase